MTLEIVYVWPDGHELVHFRRPWPSIEGEKLALEALGRPPYLVRIV